MEMTLVLRTKTNKTIFWSHKHPRFCTSFQISEVHTESTTNTLFFITSLSQIGGTHFRRVVCHINSWKNMHNLVTPAIYDVDKKYARVSAAELCHILPRFFFITIDIDAILWDTERAIFISCSCRSFLSMKF